MIPFGLPLALKNILISEPRLLLMLSSLIEGNRGPSICPLHKQKETIYLMIISLQLIIDSGLKGIVCRCKKLLLWKGLANGLLKLPGAPNSVVCMHGWYGIIGSRLMIDDVMGVSWKCPQLSLIATSPLTIRNVWLFCTTPSLLPRRVLATFL